MALVQPFLEQCEKGETAIAALKVVGHRDEVRDLVWKQLKQGDGNAPTKAAELLFELERELPELRKYMLEFAMRQDSDWPPRHLSSDLLTKFANLDKANSRSTDWIATFVEQAPSSFSNWHEAAVSFAIENDLHKEQLISLAQQSRYSSYRDRLWRKYAQEPQVRALLTRLSLADLRPLRIAYYSRLAERPERMPQLRAHFNELLKESRSTGADRDAVELEISEMVGALARDPESLPELRELVASPRKEARARNRHILATILHVMHADTELRRLCRDRISETDWSNPLLASDADALLTYFANDTVAKATVAAQVPLQGNTYLPFCFELLAGSLDTYDGAREVVRNYLDYTVDPNVAQAAGLALLDETRVIANYQKQLDHSDSTQRSWAAEALYVAEGHDELLAKKAGNSDKNVREYAYKALLRAGEINALAKCYDKEDEAHLRYQIVDAVAARHESASSGGSETILRKALLSDYAPSVRARAAEVLGRQIEPLTSLREYLASANFDVSDAALIA